MVAESRENATVISAFQFWTRPLVLLNLLAVLGILVSVVLIYDDLNRLAWSVIALTSGPETVYSTLLIHH